MLNTVLACVDEGVPDTTNTRQARCVGSDAGQDAPTEAVHDEGHITKPLPPRRLKCTDPQHVGAAHELAVHPVSVQGNALQDRRYGFLPRMTPSGPNPSSSCDSAACNVNGLSAIDAETAHIIDVRFSSKTRSIWAWVAHHASTIRKAERSACLVM